MTETLRAQQGCPECGLGNCERIDPWCRIPCYPQPKRGLSRRDEVHMGGPRLVDVMPMPYAPHRVMWSQTGDLNDWPPSDVVTWRYHSTELPPHIWVARDENNVPIGGAKSLGELVSQLGGGFGAATYIVSDVGIVFRRVDENDRHPLSLEDARRILDPERQEEFRRLLGEEKYTIQRGKALAVMLESNVDSDDQPDLMSATRDIARGT